MIETGSQSIIDSLQSLLPKFSLQLCLKTINSIDRDVDDPPSHHLPDDVLLLLGVERDDADADLASHHRPDGLDARHDHPLHLLVADSAICF